MAHERAPERGSGSPPPPAHRWRLILGEGSGDARAPAPRDGPLNMAVDQALLDAVAAGGPPVIRLYRWSPATLSFGRNQPARGLYDEEAAAARGIAFVRRPTGGQAVLHDHELTYAVVAPVEVIGKPRTAYRRINAALLAGLGELGIAAALAGGEAGRPGGLDAGAADGVEEAPSAPSWADACFRRPEPGEVVAGGRKLVGSAQRTHARTILQHGSILLSGTQAPAEELLLTGRAGQVAAGWTTVESELGRRPEIEGLVTALVTGFEVTLGITLARSTLTSRERAGAGELRGRFGAREWTWRR